MVTQKKKSSHRRASLPSRETDGAYFLKIVLYVILGSLWLKFAHPMQLGDFTLYGAPIGLVIGMIFASHDHFQVDRKIEYVILILMVIITYFLPAGVVI